MNRPRSESIGDEDIRKPIWLMPKHPASPDIDDQCPPGRFFLLFITLIIIAAVIILGGMMLGWFIVMEVI